MKDQINNPEKHSVLSGYGLFARFVHLPPNPTKGQIMDRGQKGGVS
jgi:hypothetical protein